MGPFVCRAELVTPHPASVLDIERLAPQFRFIVELDRLKSTLRRTVLTDGSRQENSAEHSWHLAMMAVLLAEHAEPGVDLPRVLKMVLVHDVVEIDAGDTFCYDAEGNLDKADRERRAADRLFGLLPPDQSAELRGLWEEFEAEATADARYAIALDRMQPLLQNFHSQGGTWRLHGIARHQVLARMEPIRTATPSLWPTVQRLVDEACDAGWIAREDGNVPALRPG